MNSSVDKSQNFYGLNGSKNEETSKCFRRFSTIKNTQTDNRSPLSTFREIAERRQEQERQERDEENSDSKWSERGTEELNVSDEQLINNKDDRSRDYM